MAVDEETVRHIARLARISVAPEEEAGLAKELDGILQWIDALQAVDSEGVKPMTSVVASSQRLREDAVTDGGKRDDILANAPNAVGAFFTVPKVVE